MHERQKVPFNPGLHKLLASRPPWQPDVLLAQMSWPNGQLAAASGHRLTSLWLAVRR